MLYIVCNTIPTAKLLTATTYIPEENHQTLFDNRKHIKMSFGGPLNVGRQCEQRAPHIGHRLVPPVFRPCVNTGDDGDSVLFEHEGNKKSNYVLYGMYRKFFA